MNASKEPVFYLCPDNFLIDQTCEQARQFGIATCTADPELPDAFMNGPYWAWLRHEAEVANILVFERSSACATPMTRPGISKKWRAITIGPIAHRGNRFLLKPLSGVEERIWLPETRNLEWRIPAARLSPVR